MFAEISWKLWDILSVFQVQPLLSIARAEEEMKEKEEELKKAMENAEANEVKRKELEASLTEAMTEKEKMMAELQTQTDCLISAEEKLMQTQTLKVIQSLIRRLKKILFGIWTKMYQMWLFVITIAWDWLIDMYYEFRQSN